MHELYIAESIIGSVKRSLPAGVAPETVGKVYVDVGRLDAVVPETLLFLFDAIKTSKQLPNAELVVNTVEVRCHCKHCGNDFDLDSPLFICPVCGGVDLDVSKGRGIILTRIIAEEE